MLKELIKSTPQCPFYKICSSLFCSFFLCATEHHIPACCCATFSCSSTICSLYCPLLWHFCTFYTFHTFCFSVSLHFWVTLHCSLVKWPSSSSPCITIATPHHWLQKLLTHQPCTNCILWCWFFDLHSLLLCRTHIIWSPPRGWVFKIISTIIPNLVPSASSTSHSQSLLCSPRDSFSNSHWSTPISSGIGANIQGSSLLYTPQAWLKNLMDNGLTRHGQYAPFHVGSSMKTTKIIYWMLSLCLLCVV